MTQKVLYISPAYENYTRSLFSELDKLKNFSFYFLYPEDQKKKLNKIKLKFKYSFFEQTKISNFFEDKFEISYYKINNLNKIIQKIKPKKIIIHYRHILNLFLNFKILYFIRKNNIEILLRSSPILVPEFKTYLKKKFNQKNKNFFIKILFNLKLIDLFVYMYFKIIFRLTNKYICYHPGGLKIYRSYGINKKKIFITYNSTDTNELLKLDKNIKNIKKKYDLVFIGAHQKWKKIDLILHALSHLNKKYENIKCCIMGNGPYNKKLVEISKILNVQKNVHFTGQVSNKKKLKILKSSKIFVLPGNGGLAINDAMFAGLPIIYTKADGTEKYLLKNKVNGLFFLENNVSDLVKKIDFLLKNNSRGEIMGKISKKIILGKINIKNVIKNFQKALEAKI